MPLVNGLPDSYSAWGISRRRAGDENPIEPHFHDCDEWYFLLQGAMRVRSGDVIYEMKAGDVLLTPMGEEHEIILIHEDTEMFWLEGPLQGLKRKGHLHRGIDE